MSSYRWTMSYFLWSTNMLLRMIHFPSMHSDCVAQVNILCIKFSRCFLLSSSFSEIIIPCYLFSILFFHTFQQRHLVNSLSL